jgi:hypothetical protein
MQLPNKSLLLLSVCFLACLLQCTAYPGWGESGKRVKDTRCGDNCLNCGGIFGDICITCPMGYYLKDNECVTCSDSCQECEGPQENNCKTCKFDFHVLFEGKCAIESRHLQSTNLYVSQLPFPNSSIYLNVKTSVYYNLIIPNVTNLTNATTTTTTPTTPTTTPVTPPAPVPNATIDIYVAFNGLTSWFAIGFGAPTMVGSDMITFEFINNVTLVVSDRYSSGFSMPALDTSLGGTSDVTLISWTTNATSTIVRVRRALNTTDANDYILTNGTLFPMIWAWGMSQTLNDHNDNGAFGSYMINLTNNTWSTAESLVNPYRSLILSTHGMAQFIIWGVLFEINSVIPRYLRAYPKYMKLHGIGMFVLTICGLGFATLAQVIDNDAGLGYLTGNQNVKAHMGCGWLILIVSIVQCLTFGPLLKRNIDGQGQPNRIYWIKLAHKIVGWFILLMSKIQLLIGAKIYGNQKYFPHMFGYVGLIVLFRISFEICYVMLNKQYNTDALKVVPNRSTLTEDQKKLLELIEDGNPVSFIRKQLPKMKYFLVGNRVFDLSHVTHPGGNALWELTYGRDVSRFFFGAYGPERIPTLNARRHTVWAWDLLNKNCIGELQPAAPLVQAKTFKKGETMMIEEEKEDLASGKPLKTDDVSLIPKKVATSRVAKANHTVTGSPQVWKIREKGLLTEDCTDVHRFEFESEHVFIKTHINSVDWFGTYFILNFKRAPYRKRNYSLALCMTKNNEIIRNSMITYFEGIMNQTVKGSYKCPVQPHYKNKILTLIFKQYNSMSGISQKLHRGNFASNEMEIEIEGPVGRGLGLSTASQGRHIILATGTGILPFLDLLNYLLVKAMSEVLAHNAQTDEEPPKDKIQQTPFSFQPQMAKNEISTRQNFRPNTIEDGSSSPSKVISPEFRNHDQLHKVYESHEHQGGRGTVKPNFISPQQPVNTQDEADDPSSPMGDTKPMEWNNKHGSVIAATGMEKAASLNIHAEPYADTFKPDFEVDVHAVFREEKAIIGKDILYKLREIYEKYGASIKNKVNIKVYFNNRIVNQGDVTFNKDFFEKNKIIHGVEKVYISGSPLFNNTAYVGVSAQGVEQDRIILV